MNTDTINKVFIAAAVVTAAITLVAAALHGPGALLLTPIVCSIVGLLLFMLCMWTGMAVGAWREGNYGFAIYMLCMVVMVVAPILRGLLR